MTLDPAIVAALRAEQARGWQRWGQTTAEADAERAQRLVDAVTPADCYDDSLDDLTIYAGRDGGNLADRIAALRREKGAQ